MSIRKALHFRLIVQPNYKVIILKSNDLPLFFFFFLLTHIIRKYIYEFTITVLLVFAFWNKSFYNNI